MKKDHIITSCGGFTLIELLIAVFIMGVAIPPMVKAFYPIFQSVTIEEKILVTSNQALGTLNRITTIDFATLNDNSGDPVNLVDLFDSSVDAAAQEDFVFRGQSYTPTVAIVDASAGVDGLLKITVTVGNISFETLKADY